MIKIIYKQSLKIPNGQSEAVSQRTTDNTMTKEKKTTDNTMTKEKRTTDNTMAYAR